MTLWLILKDEYPGSTRTRPEERGHLRSRNLANGRASFAVDRRSSIWEATGMLGTAMSIKLRHMR